MVNVGEYVFDVAPLMAVPPVLCVNHRYEVATGTALTETVTAALLFEITLPSVAVAGVASWVMMVGVPAV